VRIGSSLFPSAPMNTEPVTGGGFVSSCWEPAARVVPSFARAAATPFAPPFAVMFQAKRLSARTIVAQSSRKFLYARAQSSAAYVSGTPKRMSLIPPTLTW
jgi:hypothetical protein